MGLSSRFGIAVHILCVLALRAEEWVASSFIAASIKTNPVVVRRLLGSLKSAGLVRAEEGPAGGYRLARKAQAISLDRVYRAVEPEPLFAPHPHRPERRCPVGAGIEQALSVVYTRAGSGLAATLSKETVADVLSRALAAAG